MLAGEPRTPSSQGLLFPVQNNKGSDSASGPPLIPEHSVYSWISWGTCYENPVLRAFPTWGVRSHKEGSGQNPRFPQQRFWLSRSAAGPGVYILITPRWSDAGGPGSTYWVASLWSCGEARASSERLQNTYYADGCFWGESAVVFNSSGRGEWLSLLHSPPKQNPVAERRSLFLTPCSPLLGSVINRAWKKQCLPDSVLLGSWGVESIRVEIGTWCFGFRQRHFFRPLCIVQFHSSVSPRSRSWRLPLFPRI